jgi:hypothetical protein
MRWLKQQVEAICELCSGFTPTDEREDCTKHAIDEAAFIRCASLSALAVCTIETSQSKRLLGSSRCPAFQAAFP